MIRRIVLFVLLAILALFFIIILGSYLLLGTNTGYRWSSQKLEALVPGLEMTASAGNLDDGISAEKVRWKNDTLTVDIEELDSKWSSGCLVKFTYCLDQLKLGIVTVTSRPDTSADRKPSGPILLPSIKLPIAIEAREMTIDRLKLDLAADSKPIVLKNLRLKSATLNSAIQHAANLDGATLSSARTDDASNGQRLSIKRLEGQWEQHSVAVSGVITLAADYPLDTVVSLYSRKLVDGQDLSAELNLSGSLQDLQVNGYTRGAIDARVTGSLNPLQPGLPAELNLGWAETGWPVTTHKTVRSTDATLTVQGTLDDYEIDLKTNLSGNGFPPLGLQVKGKVNPQRALLPTIDLLTLDGYATGSAAVDWTQDVAWIAQLIAKDIDPGTYWADMGGTLNALAGASGVLVDGQWSLDIDQLAVDGTLREFPFELNATLGKSLDEVWDISELTLDNGPNQLQLSGSYGDTLDLKSTIDFPAIHYLVPGTAGNIKADAAISGSLEKPSIKLDASSSLIKLGRNLFREVKLETDVLAAGDEVSSVKLQIGRLNANAEQFNDVRIGIDGILGEHSIKASVRGPQETAVSLRATGALDEAANWLGKLNAAQLSLPAHTAVLKNKPALSWQNDTATFTIDPHCWGIEGASLCLKNPLPATTTGTAVLELSEYRLNKLNSLLPETAALGGKLDATARVNWGAADDARELAGDDEELVADTTPFKLELAAAVTNGRVSVRDAGKTRHSFRFQSLKLNTRADNYTVTSDLTLTSRDLGNGEVGLTLNPRNPTKNIAGELSLKQFDIAFLQAFLPQISDIGGTVNVAGKIAGSLSDPEFNGSVFLFDPVLRSADLPLPIEGGTVEARITGQRARLDGKLQSGDGTIELDGNVSWLNQTPRARINIIGKSLSVQQAPVTYAQINPTIRLDFSPQRLGVSGNVVVPSADINIRELPEGTTALSSDVVIIEEIAEQPLNEETTPLDVSVKVDVTLGKDVNLSGYGLEAKLSGDISVTKRGEDPVQLGGEIIVSEGFYRSYGQDLTVNDGRILFVGPVERTTLNIDAVREIENEDRIAGLHLEGNIRDPQVTLFTEPADKTQESILSYIVLGRDLGAGTDTDENQLLAAAALALTLKEGKGFATGFAESLGISDFSMTTGGSGDDTQVIVSGRLSSRLLLRYGRSVFDAEDTLFLRYDISKRLYLEAARGVERAVDLFYSFSF